MGRVPEITDEEIAAARLRDPNEALRLERSREHMRAAHAVKHWAGNYDLLCLVVDHNILQPTKVCRGASLSKRQGGVADLAR